MAEENKILIKFLTGDKGNIDAKMADHTIDAGDIVLTKDTDEMIFINPEGMKKVIKSKTQKNHTSKHEIGGIKNGEMLNSNLDFDRFLDKLFGGSDEIQIGTNNELYYGKEGIVRNITLNVKTSVSGTIKVYFKKGNGAAELVGQGVGTTYSVTHTISASDQTTNTDFYYYAILNDDQISNNIHIRIAPMVFCNCSTYTGDLATANWALLYSENDSKDLFGELKNEYSLKLQKDFSCARFVITKDIVSNTNVRVYSEDGDDITTMFTINNIINSGKEYFDFKYNFPIAYPNNLGYYTIKVNL